MFIAREMPLGMPTYSFPLKAFNLEIKTLRKKFPLILVMLVSRLHINPDQLKDETTPTICTTMSCDNSIIISLPFLGKARLDYIKIWRVVG